MSQTLKKGLDLLTFVSEGEDTLPKLAKASGWSKSTVHRLASVLVEQGLLRTRDRRYRLGHRMLELGEAARRQLSYLQLARPHLEEASRRTLETVHLAELADGHVIYLERIEGERGLLMRSHVGLRLPAQVTALGKVLIAHLSRSEWDAHLLELPARTEHTITDRDQLLSELETVRRQGYALDREENERGTRCVAAPIRDASGEVIAAVSISGASIYIDERRQLELVPIVQACADAVSADLGAARDPRIRPTASSRTRP